MDQRDGPSFDPRHWNAPPSGAASPTDSASFDPHSWIAPPAPPPPPPAPPAPKPPRDRRPLLAAASSLAILVTGGIAAFVSRPTTPPVATAAAAPAAMPSGATDASTSQRTLILSGAADIAPSLGASGIAADEAIRAGRQAAAALGAGTGDIRLIFDMVGKPGAATLARLEATHDDGSGLTLIRAADGRFTEQRQAAHLVTKLEVVRGELDAESFYSSAVAAGINDNLVGDFANAFVFDFDMQREVAPGDIFEAGFQQRYNAAGDPVGLPVLVYAALNTATKSRALYRFSQAGDKKPGWYDSNGRSTVRTLMRTPIDGARISSQFGFREHPVLGFVKMHKGTDFAAPTGTPIFASGDAIVDFAGPKGANGNFVRLRHDNGWQTLYLHMNRIWPGIAPGVRVTQGEQIGEVGTTGRSTGPHLHYEVHIDGQPVNPLSIETGSGGRTLTGTALEDFRRLRDKIDARRADSY
ncbi:M23 family metallopeptidase [Sphingomonas sp. PB4P5]|uniref:M23 family metallopeptidase n=1 Tax=Parasphingomonas puruogangriensis TaxID=3096155 RepID=UPI002FC64F95